MQTQESIPPQIAPARTGKERWNTLVELQREQLLVHSIVIFASARPRAMFPESHNWIKDLRKGRLNLIGGFVRFLLGMSHRGLGADGREYALQILECAHRCVDIVFPVPAPTSSTGQPKPIPRLAPRPIGVQRAHLTIARRKSA